MKVPAILFPLIFITVGAFSQSSLPDRSAAEPLVIVTPKDIDFRADGVKRYLEAITVMKDTPKYSQSDKDRVMQLVLTAYYGAKTLGTQDLAIKADSPFIRIVFKCYPEIGIWDRTGTRYANDKEIKLKFLGEYFEQYSAAIRDPKLPMKDQKIR